MSEWQTVKLGEIADVFDGPHATPKKTTHGPWFLSISSLSSGRLDLSQSAHLSEEDYVIWTRRVTPREGDVLFSYETRLGEAAMMPAGLRACLGRRMGLLRPKIDRVNPRFLFYTYLSPVFQQQIRERTVHGATVDRIPISEMPSWEVRLPDGQTQERIASVLGALDDKIALNDRIIRTCDALCGAFFQRMLGSSDIRYVKIEEIADINRESVKPNRGGHLRYLDISSVSLGSINWPERMSWEYAPSRARRKASQWDTLWSTVRPGRRSYALILENDPELVVSTGFCVITPRAVGPASLYEVVRRDEFVEYLESMSEGSAYPAVRPERIAQAVVPLPQSSELQKFERHAMKLRRRIRGAEAETRNLARIRHALLPKLISGEIGIRDAEQVAEEVT